MFNLSTRHPQLCIYEQHSYHGYHFIFILVELNKLNFSNKEGAIEWTVNQRPDAWRHLTHQTIRMKKCFRGCTYTTCYSKVHWVLNSNTFCLFLLSAHKTLIDWLPNKRIHGKSLSCETNKTPGVQNFLSVGLQWCFFSL